MIIYIHGFASCAEGNKARIFREYFQNRGKNFIAISLSYVPELAIKTLEDLIESYDTKVSLIGSSLGGYYALYLAQKYRCKAVLINPAIFPYKTLSVYLGSVGSYCDRSSFEWTQKHIEMLKKYEVTSLSQKNILLLLQKGDESLDYKEAVRRLPDAHLILEEGGSHSFDGIERYFQKVELFFS